MALAAIKQNEPAAEAAGIDTLRWKMRAIVLSGAIAAARRRAVRRGAAGGHAADGVRHADFRAGAGGDACSAASARCGARSIGAAILVPLSETLQAHLGNVIPGIQGVVYGLAIILVILLAPEGVLWRVRDPVWRRAVQRLSRPARSNLAHRVAASCRRRCAHLPHQGAADPGGERNCRSPSAACKAVEGGRASACTAARSSASSAPTAPARRPCSIC